MNTERLKRFRTEYGYTEKMLADRLGISQSRYAVIEKGLTEPSLSLLKKLGKITGYTLDELVFEDAEGARSIEKRYFDLRARLFWQLFKTAGSGNAPRTEALKKALSRLEMLEGAEMSEAAESYRLALKICERQK